MDWISELFDEKPASAIQVSIIEGLLITSGISEKEKEYIGLNLDNLSEEDAYKTIDYLKSNNIPTDPKDRWAYFLRNKI